MCVQVNYKNVMEQYGLGPNGGILTSLNLFATKFDQARISVRLKVAPATAHLDQASPRALGASSGTDSPIQ